MYLPVQDRTAGDRELSGVSYLLGILGKVEFATSMQDHSKRSGDIAARLLHPTGQSNEEMRHRDITQLNDEATCRSTPMRQLSVALDGLVRA